MLCCSRFPEYLFISNRQFSFAAQKLRRRFTEGSLRGIILDSHFLSLTDYLVCGLTSNVRVGDSDQDISTYLYRVEPRS